MRSTGSNEAGQAAVQLYRQWITVIPTAAGQRAGGMVRSQHLSLRSFLQGLRRQHGNAKAVASSQTDGSNGGGN